VAGARRRKRDAAGGRDRKGGSGAPSIRSQLIIIGLLPLMAVGVVVARVGLSDYERYENEKVVATASTAVARLAVATERVRSESVTALDLVTLETTGLVTSAVFAQRAADALDSSTRERFGAIQGATDEALRVSVDAGDMPDGVQSRVANLAAVRSRLVAGAMTPPEVDLFYERLITGVEASLQQRQAVLNSSPDPEVRSSAVRQQALGSVLIAAGDTQRELTVALERMLMGGRVDWPSLGLASRQLRLAEESAALALDPQMHADWFAGRDGLRVGLDRIDRTVARSPGPADADLERLIESALTARLDIVESSARSAEALSQVTSETAARATEASSDALTSLGRSAWFVFLALLLLVVGIDRITRSIVRPLRRASRIATEVNAGRLSDDRVGTSGPAEVRAVGGALDGLVETMQVIERQAIAVADGDFAAPVLGAQLPGDLGRSLETSIGQWRAATEQAQSANALTRAIADATTDAQLLCDVELRVVEANPAARILFDQESILHADLVELLRFDSGDDLRTSLAATGQVAGAAVGRASSGDVPVIATLTRVVSGGETMHSVLIRDVSEQKALHDHIAWEATHDPLTAIGNRRHFINQLGSHLGCAGVVLLDLDGFRGLNDRHGQAAGDHILIELARRISSHVEPNDEVLAARLGGDEFAIFVPDCPGLGELRTLAAGIQELVRLPIALVTGEQVELDACVGIATGAPGEGDAALLDATVALTHAKSAGRGAAMAHDDELRELIERRERVERDLERAIREDELVLWFQPVVDIDATAIVGVEALIRWPRDDGTMIPPMEFIPIAEESSLIVDLDRWVVNECCRRLDSWNATSLAGLHIAMNVSGRHLAEGDLAAAVAHGVDQWGIDASRLSIEITESFLADDLAHTRGVLDRLHALGVQLLIDDFGTGYSSLSYLQELPFDVLKIDRSFVSRLGTDATSESIVDALIGLGHTMGLRVLAEGIETAAQWAHLRAAGCDLLQGFLLARPMPAEQLPETSLPALAEQELRERGG